VVATKESKGDWRMALFLVELPVVLLEALEDLAVVEFVSM
jgi:hypothetical protein